jgi:hypothetical protein
MCFQQKVLQLMLNPTVRGEASEIVTIESVFCANLPSSGK